MRTALLILAVCLCGCASHKPPKPLDQRIGAAHGLDMYKYQDGMSGDIHLAFTDGTQFDAHFTVDLKTGRNRMQLADESVLVFDGRDSWVYPAESAIPNARYHLRLWPFLVTLPLQLHAPGATLSGPADARFGSTDYDGLTLSFGPNAGDRANDSFLLFVDKQSSLVKAAACTIANGRPAAQAGAGAIAFSFYNFKQNSGLFLAENWTIWQYSIEQGIYGQPIGQARVYNLEFYKPKESTFTPPAGARREHDRPTTRN
jgi:hypothetical protein